MIAFRDVNFKLLVVEQLMYGDKTLTPAFDMREHMRARGVEDLHTYIEQNALEHTVLDEARAYFEALEIPAGLLTTVEELTFDGGLQVFMECAPIWDGEDDLFDLHSLDDLDLLPNLKLFSGAEMLELMLPDGLEILAARGIAVR
ncbi:hypothetical protein LIX60_05170 [Streptomyces sp. S07_1.15]|uniref:DUF6892 domain-containing protein n=1 Tax=Streptomyces sp. S07_1.15 TaxID=2873925 RepID=UPI001D13C2C1|nr:hypothetical protein [Streptomyces sp. S07_1.15]MCC3650876.1 hypothetical protein [Streptomyces sp. S07_1.15]